MNPGKNAIKLTKFLQMESFADFMALVFYVSHPRVPVFPDGLVALRLDGGHHFLRGAVVVDGELLQFLVGNDVSARLGARAGAHGGGPEVH